MNQTSETTWGDGKVGPGEKATVSLTISESYSGADVKIPMVVWRGKHDGPTVFITAAVHGDEINGTGTIRNLLRDAPFELRAGTLILVPVVNMFGFERHSRYLPDRRDLNRSFPGSTDGSLASRLAHAFFHQVVKRCDYGIDLHTAAVRRTNFPNVRANMTDSKLAAFARAFGAELIVSGQGPEGSLRHAACTSGIPTLILEAGEVWKVEPSVLTYGLNGITNCLAFLNMIDQPLRQPPYRIETDATKWVRAKRGGFLEFHVAPGDIVNEGDPLATNTSLTGEEHSQITAPRSGVVLGMTTIPSVSPGDPVYHLAFPRQGQLKRVERIIEGLSETSLHSQIREDLASGLAVTPGQNEGHK
ncbi:succinylglutamate desuccinylase/aspartoacylase family protein [Mucisphaera sp.]|uniref:succinylglutamate desuccinylase/aspartoacylase family protein n=1 Tax=Mucisphaera sp. TaxID=2913024 RepID=UPI003D0B0A1A